MEKLEMQVNKPKKFGFYDNFERNHKQICSILGGAALLIASGMHLGWGIWNISRAPMFEVIVLYIAAIVGSFIGSYPLNSMHKKTIYYIVGAICMASNILFIYSQHGYGVLVGRTLAGLGYGILYVHVLFHAADNAHHNKRGLIVMSITFAIAVGMYISAMSVYDKVHLQIDIENQAFGMYALLFTIFGILITPFATYESVPQLIRYGQEREAMNNMMILRAESIETSDIRQNFLEITQMLKEGESDQVNVFADGNLKALLLMTMTRLLGFVVCNWTINLIQMKIVIVALELQIPEMAAFMITGMRVAFSVIAFLTNDIPRRKLLFGISAVFGSLVLLGIGILWLSVELNQANGYFFIGMICLYQLAVSIGINPMQDVLLSEAFSFKNRMLSVTFVTSIEHLLHLGMVVLVLNTNMEIENGAIILMFSSGIMLVGACILYLELPETVRLTLRESCGAFNNQNRAYVEIGLRHMPK